MIAKSAVLAGLLFTGLSFTPAPAPAAAPFAASPAPAPVTGPPTAEPPADAAFLIALHQGDLAEIAGGGIARERGVSARVRALGARFVGDHTAIDARLTALARAAGVTLPDTPTAAQLELAKEYQSAPSASFDRLYVRTQLKAHDEAMAAAKAELARGADPRVKRLVAFAAPLVAAHRRALAAAAYGGPAR